MSEEAASAEWLEDQAGNRIPLRKNFTIGRAAANSLALKDPEQRVSSYHARIGCDADGSYFVEDRYSTNGTFLNDRKVRRQELSDGDRLRFGSQAVFVFRSSRAGHLPAATDEKTAATMRNYEERDCWFLIGDIKNSSSLATSLNGIALAQLVSDWAARCRDAVERHGGTLSNRTGDGWLVLWVDGPGVVHSVAAALEELRKLQGDKSPAFRVLVHRGRATIAGAVRAGEENVLSAELHQAFRMEKVAAQLGCDLLASNAAAERLAQAVPCSPVPGSFPLAGFKGAHQFFEIKAGSPVTGGIEEATRTEETHEQRVGS